MLCKKITKVFALPRGKTSTECLMHTLTVLSRRRAECRVALEAACLGSYVIRRPVKVSKHQFVAFRYDFADYAPSARMWLCFARLPSKQQAARFADVV
ncbi:hypothetical protein SAMN05421548_10599 [Paraburkholderia lycopersici]|uniref:Uncharacterized protein n=1 Tax=Paraburkholderia lycopersici TaxID=416944 RepID=A0A1G6K555_9BURK|nr:hypothetical protein SAMN05421548_10599 [Paraburkholderia lycopersici]